MDLASFEKKTFGMFGGRDVKVRLLCKNDLAGVLLDRFGPDLFMMPEDEEHFTASVMVTVSRQFFGWVTAIGEDMRIEAPAEIREEYREYLRRILED